MKLSAVNCDAQRRVLFFPVTSRFPYILILSLSLFSIEPQALRPDWWIGILLIFSFVNKMFLKGRFRVDYISKMTIWVHGAVLLSLLANCWEWGKPQWVEFGTLWLQLVFATLLYISLLNLEFYLIHLRSMLRFWVIIAVIVSAYALYQLPARNFGWPLAYIQNYLHGEVTEAKLQWGLGFVGYIRPSSFLREPTYLSNYLLAPMLITAALFFYRQDRRWLFHQRWMNAMALMVMFSAWMAAFSAAGYLTLITVLILSFLMNRGARKLVLYLSFALLASGLVLAIISLFLDLSFSTALVERVWRIVSTAFWHETSSIDASAFTRIQEILLALRVWMDYPLFGIGLNQLQFVGEEYKPENWPPYVQVGYMHNMWLEVLVQTGIVGFVPFIFLWIYSAKKMNHIANKKNHLGVLALGVFFVILADMVYGLMGHPFTFPAYWFHLWLASVIYRHYENNRKEPASLHVP